MLRGGAWPEIPAGVIIPVERVGGTSQDDARPLELYVKENYPSIIGSEVSLRVLHFDSWRGARTLIADGLATSPTSASSGRSVPGLEGLEG